MYEVEQLMIRPFGPRYCQPHSLCHSHSSLCRKLGNCQSQAQPVKRPALALPALAVLGPKSVHLAMAEFATAPNSVFFLWQGENGVGRASGRQWCRTSQQAWRERRKDGSRSKFQFLHFKPRYWDFVDGTLPATAPLLLFQSFRVLMRLLTWYVEIRVLYLLTTRM